MRRNREVTQFSFFLLVIRAAFQLMIIAGFVKGAVIDHRFYLLLGGNLWHLAILPLTWKFPIQLQRFHAPSIIISYSLFLFNPEEAFSDPSFALSNALGLLLFSFSSAVIVNSNWVLTGLATAASYGGSIAYYSLVLNYKQEVIIFSFTINAIVVIYTAYICEKRHKTEFLQMRHHEQLYQDIREVLQKLPEGILLFNAQSKEVILENNQLNQIFKNSSLSERQEQPT